MRLVVGLCVGLWALVANAAAAPAGAPDTLQQRIAACTSCHGKHGEGGGNGFNPRIAGKPALYLYRQLLNFRDGRRSYPLMEHVVQPLTDGYLREIADYFAAQHPPHASPQASGLSRTMLARGEALVRDGDAKRGIPACQACHGESLTGVEPAIPALVGLPYDYISAQLGSWRTHTRGAPAPDCMATIASRLGDSDITAVAGWLATQPVPGDARPASHSAHDLPLPCGSVASDASASTLAGNSHAALKRGEYLALAGDCVSCHTARGGAPYAGGRGIPTPFGTVYAPNITPDAESGIGRWSADDFWHALHDGKAPDGRLLYPAFPYPSYTRVTRADADAIHAFLRSVPAVKRANRAPQLDFPYNVRKLLLAWRALYFDAGEFKPTEGKSAQWNRGAYLVQGLGHCNDCHTPRNLLGATEDAHHLAGAMIPVQDWYAPDLGTQKGGGLHGWSADDIADLLRSGRSARGSAYGPMAEVVQRSLQFLSDEDVRAIAAYLVDAPPRKAASATVGLVAPQTQAQHLVTEGKEIYAKQCADCHGDDGRGKDMAYPPLAGNSSILGNEVNAIRAVLLGGFEVETRTNLRPYSMPPFAPTLDDREVAAVVSYIRQAWDNQATAVAPTSVTRYRSAPQR
jgi:mono/diheme cytochrome c family protein